MSNDGTKAESMDNGVFGFVDDEGGGSRNDFCSVGVDSFNGELTVEDDEDDEGVFGSIGSKHDIRLD